MSLESADPLEYEELREESRILRKCVKNVLFVVLDVINFYLVKTGV